MNFMNMILDLQTIEKLEELGELKENGLITQEEFECFKNQLLHKDITQQNDDSANNHKNDEEKESVEEDDEEVPITAQLLHAFFAVLFMLFVIMFALFLEGNKL